MKRKYILIGFLLAAGVAWGQSPYNLQSQQPISPAPYSLYSNPVTTQPLPSDVMMHLLGNTSNAAASDAMAKCTMLDCANSAYPPTVFELDEVSNPTFMGILAVRSPGTSDLGTPFYYCDASCPWYSVTAATSSGAAAIKFHAPNAAPFTEGTGDEFLAVYDQATGWVVSFYVFGSGHALPAASGCGGSSATACPITGIPYESACQAFSTCQDYGYGPNPPDSNGVGPYAITTRKQEIQFGVINHALSVTVDCETTISPHYVFPAGPAFGSQGYAGLCGAGSSGPQNAARPYSGTLLFTDYTPAQLTSLCTTLPAWQCSMLTALSTYGAYVKETSLSVNTGMNFVHNESSEAWKYQFPATYLTVDPFWAWANAQQGFDGTANLAHTGCSGTYNCLGSVLANLPRLVGPASSNSVDAHGNSCTSAPGCLGSGHLHVADQCVAKQRAGVAGGCGTIEGPVLATAFNSQWVAADPYPPPIWPPTDSNGNVAAVYGMRAFNAGETLGDLAPTSPGTINWSGGGALLNEVVNTLATNSGLLAPPLNVIYTLYNVPSWAALGTDSNCVNYSSGCVPFNDMDASSSTCNATQNPTGTQNATVLANCGNGTDAHFQNIMYQVISRFAGKGMAYECWNEPDGMGGFWSNAAAYGGLGHAPTLANQPPLTRLVRLCADLAQMVHQLDPTAILLTPSVHGAQWASWWPLFAGTSVSVPACTGPCSAAIGGATWAAYSTTGAQIAWDVTNGHLRGQVNNVDPTQFLAIYADMTAAQAIPSNGLPSTFFDDEWGPTHSSEYVNLNTTAGYIAEGLVLRASVPLARESFFQWNAGEFFPQGTIAGLGWDTVAGKWLIGSTVNATTNSGTVYSTTGTNPTYGSFKVLFDSSQTCSTSSCNTANQSAGGFTSYMDIFGVNRAVVGGVVPVGFQPVFLNNAGSLPTAATPTFSPVAGTYAASQSVAISSTSAGAIECYNFTGSPMTNGTTGCAAGSTLYTAPVLVNVDETLYAVAGGTGFSDSPVGSAAYVFQGSAPTFSPAAGTYTGAQTVTISQAQALAMCYTLDGSTPASNGLGSCSNGSLYVGAITVSVSETVKAIGMASGWTDSAVGSAAYVINYTLTLSSVTGLGSVQSSPLGINNCSSSCSAIFVSGSTVNLTATAGSNYVFSTFAGAGCGASNPCAVTMSGNQSVSVTFLMSTPPAPAVSVQGFVF